MKIHNEAWFPLTRKYAHMAKVSDIAMVFEEDVDVAGMFDPEHDCIIVNMAPNVLAEVAVNYQLKPSELEKIAACVFLEECVHSQGVDNEDQARIMARFLSEAISKKDLKHKGGMATYAKEMLSNNTTA